MLNTAIHRLKVMIYNIICQAWIGSIIGFLFQNRIPAYGLTINTKSNLINNKTKAILFWGFYEKQEHDLLLDHFCKDYDVIELGSSLGVLSSFVGRLQNRDKKLVCVEANPELISKIEWNIKTNCPSKKYDLYNRAINYSGKEEMYLHRGIDHTASTLSSNQEDGWLVKTCKLSTLLKENDVENYVLIVDIEGSEIGILLNEAEALKQCKQLLIELHPTSSEGIHYSIDDMVKMLTAIHGFKYIDHLDTAYVFGR